MSVDIYQLLKKNSNKINLNIIENNFSFDFSFIELNHDLSKILLESSLELKNDDDFKQYLINDINNYPLLFFMNKSYLIRTHDFFHFDLFFNTNNTFNYIASYMINIEDQNIYSYSSDNISYLSDHQFKDHQFKFKLNKDLFVIKGDFKNTILFSGTISNSVLSISYFDNFLLAKFKNSIYNSITLDYDFNILTVEFSKKIQTKLSIKKASNINYYTSLMKIFESNLDVYNLVNDSKFNLNFQENDFYRHLKIIKETTLHKDKIFKLFLDKDFLEKKIDTKFYNESEIKLDELIKKYFNDNNNLISKELKSSHNYKYLYKHFLGSILKIKDESINPMNNKLYNLIKNLNEDVLNLHEQFIELKKDNKTFKKENKLINLKL